MKDVLTPKQVARAIGVSESSLKRWCDKGLLPLARTAGGHRRIAVSAVLAFARQTGHRIARPDMLGMPAGVGLGPAAVDRAAEHVLQALIAGDEQAARRIVFDLYLSGWKAADICDQVLAACLHAVGQHWECGELEVFEEHRACEICMRLLYELRLVVPGAPLHAPAAIGGAIEGDPYRVPTTMVEITLRELGWEAASFGANLPAATLTAAIERNRPRLVWLSASCLPSQAKFVEDCNNLFETAARHNAALVVGGRALAPEIRRQIRYSAFCDNLAHLAAFVTTLAPRAAGDA